MKSSPSHPPTKCSTLIPIRWLKKSNTHIVRDRNVAALHSLSPHDHENDMAPLGTDLKCGAARDLIKTHFYRSEAEMFTSTSSLIDPERTRQSSSTDDGGGDVCIVCMERAADFQLLPCRHDQFCRQCIIEAICTWVRPEAPSCPLCRGSFHTMVLLDRHGDS
jgi:hypothetical protein